MKDVKTKKKRKDTLTITENQYNIGMIEGLRLEAKQREVSVSALLTEIIKAHQRSPTKANQ